MDLVVASLNGHWLANWLYLHFLYSWVSLVFVQYPTCCIIYLLSSVRVLYILHACAKILLCLSGSSRQFTGFSTDVEESIINRIWEQAGVFFPTLRELSLPNFVRSRKIRVGLRPYSKWALWVLCALNFWWKVLRSYLYWVFIFILGVTFILILWISLQSF